MIDVGHLADLVLVEAEVARYRRAAALETERGHGDDELAFEHQGGGEDATGQHRALPATTVDADFVHGTSSLRSPRHDPDKRTFE